jgi:hypothetical protein
MRGANSETYCPEENRLRPREPFGGLRGYAANPPYKLYDFLRRMPVSLRPLQKSVFPAATGLFC